MSDSRAREYGAVSFGGKSACVIRERLERGAGEEKEKDRRERTGVIRRRKNESALQKRYEYTRALTDVDARTHTRLKPTSDTYATRERMCACVRENA